MAQPPSVTMADIYRFLALSMQYPDASWLDGRYFSLLRTILGELDRCGDSLEIDRSFTENRDWLESLQVEHTRLFLNGVPQVAAPPYGSVYLDPEGLLYGSSAMRVKEFYRKRNLAPAGEGDIPDHLCLELEFLALLAEQGKSGDEELFLKEHFRPWFPLFQARVLHECRHPFYRVLVQLIDFFTREELNNGFESDQA